MKIIELLGTYSSSVRLVLAHSDSKSGSTDLSGGPRGKRLGRADEARRVHEELKRRHPDITLTLTFTRERQMVLDPDYLSHYLEGLCNAGVPA